MKWILLERAPMVDSHLLVVPEILATIPFGDPLKTPVAGVLDPPVAGVPPVVARALETMAEVSGRTGISGSFYGTVSASRRSAAMLPLSLSERSGPVRQAKRRGAMRNASSRTASTSLRVASRDQRGSATRAASSASATA